MEVTLRQGKLGYETPKVEVVSIIEDVVVASIETGGPVNPDWQ